VILIIACGNILRRDDGAGIEMAERLERFLCGHNLTAERIAVHQLTPEFCGVISEDRVSAVVFVDARVCAQGRAELKVKVSPVVSATSTSPSGHCFHPSVLMLYARLLYHKEPAAWLLTVPAADFNHGEGLSETARRAISTFYSSPDCLEFMRRLTCPTADETAPEP
jgi:hydrogenase maturation protease